MTGSGTSLRWSPNGVVVISKHRPYCGNRALLAAKFEETALPTPGSPAPTYQLPSYPWSWAQASDQSLLPGCTKASGTSQYCLLSPLLSLLITGKGISAGGHPPQIICLSRGRTGDVQNGPVLRGTDNCPSQSSAPYCVWTECNSCYCVTTMGNFYKVIVRAQVSQLAVTHPASQRTQNAFWLSFMRKLVESWQSF